MLKLKPHKSFKQDLKLLSRQRKNLQLLNDVIKILQEQHPLPQKYLDHPLKGKYIGYRECHILPDWLLIYKVEQNEMILILHRTGSHAELFDK